MSHSSKAGVLAAAVGAAFLTVAGCASQGTAVPANNIPPNSCSTITQNSCKGQARCKGYASPTHHKKKHHKTTTETTTSDTETSTEAK